ncbi:MAG: ABC transporter ATP-binding protein [Propionivibrio sp.]
MLNLFESLIHPYPEATPDVPPKTLFAFLYAGTRGLRPLIVVMAVLTALIGVFEALLFGFLGSLVDWLAEMRPETFWTEQGTTLALLVAALLASPVVLTVQAMLKQQTLAANFPMLLRWNFHRLMLGQSMSFYQDEFAGRVATKVMQTALAVRDSVMIVTDILVWVSVYFISMVVVAAHFDAWLLVPFGLWLALYASAMCYFVPRLGKVAQAQADARSLMTGRVTDAYANISTVKLFSHGKREASYARSAMEEFMLTAHAQMRLVTGIEITNFSFNMLLIIGTASVGLWRWSLGEAGVGALAAATSMALRLNGISHWVMWEMARLFENLGTVQDGMNTLSRHNAVVDAPDASAIEVTRGAISFNDVRFGYGEDKRVIDGFSLNIRPGEKIGLVGRSGSGKSTLVNLLLRFYDIEAGSILIDGQNIADVTQESLRARIGMVTQDTSLLHRSVRENILYGRPDASENAMIVAAQRAEADGFIATLTDPKGRSGYDAHVGERGVKLSGGQRQRIAIARVMLKDAPILLLDEATSALDSEVEAAIQQSLYRLMEGKTVVAIAHRLSTIAAMDRLIVVNGGRIVEEGDHQSLLARGGLYARLWAHQSGGFLGENDD